MPALLIVVGAYLGATAIGTIAAVLYQAYEQRRQSKKAERRARDEFNASLKDRMVMVDITPNAPRTIALGRVRSVEGIRRRWASGTHDEKLTLVVSFAGHEIDGFETFYFDDLELTLDGDGYVQTEPYFKGAKSSHQVSLTLGDTYTIPGTIVPGSVWANGGDVNSYYSCTVTLDGNDATITYPGLPPGVSTDCMLFWQSVTGTSLARIRTYLGTDVQNVGDDLEAEYPGKITAGDAFRGIALAVVDLTYDPDVFPQGVPNVTALFRGAKVLDPRDDTTAWSENPALLAYHYARHANGWDVPADKIREADIIAAANECDIETEYTLRMPDDSTTTVTLPRYRCGIVVSTAADPRANMDEIMETMAGRWGWAGGTLRLRAGALAASAFALDASWVAQPLDGDGKPTDEPVVRMTNGLPRDAKVNRISGRCADPALRYQMLAFPAVQDDTAIAADGATYEHDRQMLAVNHIAHAQHLCRVFIRESQAPLRMDLSCNLSAYRVELFDAGTVTLVRRRVRLFHRQSGRLVRETWSDAATGAFEFRNLKAQDYLVVADDHTRYYNAVTADAVVPVP